MSYRIVKLTTGQLTTLQETNPRAKCIQLVEEGNPPIVLGNYDEDEEQEAYLNMMRWEAIDDLQERMHDFILDMINEFSDNLTEDEVREMIKEYE